MQALVCERAPLEGCGECGPCSKVEAGSHPDFLTIALEEEKRDIVIAQVRDIIVRCGYRPHEAGYRLVVVDPADRMNASAANALLKTLEEPPEATHFVLVTSAPSRLPVTIRSRCQRVRFGPVALEDATAFIARETGLSSDEARFCASLAGGSLGRGLMLAKGELAAFREAAERLHGLAERSDMVAVFQATSELAHDREELAEVLGVLRLLYRDALLVCEGLEDVAPLINADKQELVRRIAASHGRVGLRRRIALVADAEEALRSNVNAQLVLDRMLVGLRGADGMP